MKLPKCGYTLDGVTCTGHAITCASRVPTKYDAWHRHITLSMLAAAFLATTACRERLRDQKGALTPGQTS